ncbi:hypothetical protein FQN54_000386 [Arachnomyces sp. PD_36]|nr:hypothetical protein FQN54_000386 [Arachnomyces sp. PD_36]
MQAQLFESTVMNFTNEIDASPGRIGDKWQHQLNTGSADPVPVTGFSAIPHELHHIRKGALGKAFSRQQTVKLEGEVQEFAQFTLDKILRSANEEPFDVKEAFNRFTAGVISQSQSLSSGVPDYMGKDIKNVMHQMSVTIPGYIIKAALNNPGNGGVFCELLAGTETTAAILSIITYYLLTQPQTYASLMKDLQGVNPSNLQWTELEQPPYLWAIIHESLWMMPGVSHRPARIARDESLIYKSRDGNVGWAIPRGTPIGMTSMINHWDKELFPDPDKFEPARWLVDGQPNYKLQKMSITFGKRSRSCVGENLAYCEVYLMPALMALRVIPRARLYETTVEDITYVI